MEENNIVEWQPQDMLEVVLNEPDDFLKVRETLTRIGVASRKDKKLFQSCHLPKMVVLGKNDRIINFELQQSYYHNTDIDIVELSNGHMSHIENMKVFTYNIIRFIEKI